MTAREATRPPISRDDLDQLGVTCTVSVAATAMSISDQHAYRLIERDEFPIRVLRIGSRISIPTADLKAYLLGDTVDQPDTLARLDQLITAQRETIRLLSILASATIHTPTKAVS